MRRLLYISVLLIAFCTRTVFAVEVAPSSIDNQASVTFFDSKFGGVTSLSSATVHAPLNLAVPFVLKKTASVSNPLPGTELDYTINAVRNPNSLAYPVTVQVDGVPQTFYSLVDPIPAQTTLLSISNLEGGTAFYHIHNAAAGSYTATLPADLTTVDEVGVGYAQFNPNTVHLPKVALQVALSGSGTIVNTVTLHFINKSAVADSLSASASAELQSSAPQIYYYDPQFQHVIGVTHLGSPLYVEVIAPSMNLDPKVVDKITITLISNITGDQEQVQLVETGPDTGIFRTVKPVPTRSVQAHPASSGDGIMETIANDSIIAQFSDAAKHRVATNILIDPSGIVFDSQTNLPVAGARVTLINATTGLPATVFGYDGVTKVPNIQITGKDGRYVFPMVAPGTYILQVVPPPGYGAPSKVIPSKLPAGRVIDVNGSYGGVFSLSSADPVLLDIPVDPSNSGTGLFIEKTASRMSVELGDFLDYTVAIRNVLTLPVLDAVVDDRLPYGFVYVKGSARLEGKRIDDPSISRGKLTFRIGRVEAGATVKLTYRVHVVAGALQGDGVNHAEAYDRGKSGAHSNNASVRVEVTPGVFTDQGIIFGKVYVDLNRNKVQDAEEPGIPGIRLYLEDGTYVVTDIDGKYSLYGINPRLHVLKLDRTTLPPHAKLEVISSNNAGDAGSLFVDLKKGEMHKADFALSSAPSELLENIRLRKEVAEDAVTEVQSNLATPLSQKSDGSGPAVLAGSGISVDRQANLKALPASGVLGVGTANAQTNAVSASPSSLGLSAVPGDASMPRQEQSANTPWSGSVLRDTVGQEPGVVPNSTGFSGISAFPAAMTRATPIGNSIGVTTPGIPLDTAVQTSGDSKFGFVDLHDNDTLTMAQATIRVKGNAGAVLALNVNGVEVPETRIGKKILIQNSQVQAVEYVGVALRTGKNTVELIQRDAFGNTRERKSITLIAPGRLGRIVIEFPKGDARADGRTLVPVVVRLVDANGVPISARTEITLDSSVGEWAVQDLNPKEPGVQVFIEGGRGEFKLKPPLEPADAVLRVSSGAMKAQEQLAFLPELRPMIAAGLLQGELNFASLQSSFGRVKTLDSFNQDINRFSSTVDGDDATAAARSAFFIKGQIAGEFVLTAAYDSDKQSGQRLFRDVQPDDFYPIYGDSSLKGFDAQSTSSAYVKIENRKSYLLYGDFTTDSNSQACSLGNYSRSLTGIKAHLETGRVAGDAWASDDTNRQVVVEFPANGTSGPYAFQAVNGSGLMNSEKVEILTRDRNQPSLIIKSSIMTRFSDYEIEPFSGRILFKSPVPSLDEGMNPISIRISFEVDQGGSKFWVYGGDAQVRITKWLEAGGSIVQDKNPFALYNLYSANTAVRLAQNTYLVGEVAQSERQVEGIGRAERVDFRHTSDRLTAHIYWNHSDTAFANQTASLGAGRVEGGADIAYRINERTSLHLQAIDTESTEAGTRRGGLAEVQYAFAKQVRLDIGGRYSTETGNPNLTSGTPNSVAASNSIAAQTSSTPDITSIRAKLSVPLPYLNNGTLYGEYENDLMQMDRRMAAAGLEFQANQHTKFYARHEFISSLDGPFDLNNNQQTNRTVVGVQSEYMKNAQLFNEYRMNSAVDGRGSEAAIGLRNGYEIMDGLRVQTTFERVAPLVFGRGGSKSSGTTGVNAYGGGSAIGSGGTGGMGAVGNDALAVTGAFDYTADSNWKTTGRVEYRTSDTEDSLLTTLGYAQRMTDDWAFLSKVLYYDVTPKAESGGGQEQFRYQLGFAFRPAKVNIWNALAKYEFRLENNSTVPDQLSDRNVHILSADVNCQPYSFLTISGHYAVKYAQDHTNGVDSTEFGNLVAVRVLVDVGSRWDVGFNARAMMESNGRIQYGAGPEVGFRLRKNMRVAAGYNVFGVSDPDLTDDDYTQRGAYITLRMKFDESLLHLGNKGEEEDQQ